MIGLAGTNVRRFVDLVLIASGKKTSGDEIKAVISFEFPVLSFGGWLSFLLPGIMVSRRANPPSGKIRKCHNFCAPLLLW